MAGLDVGWKALLARATWRPQMLHGVRRGIRVLPFQSPGNWLGSRPFVSRPRSPPLRDLATTRGPLARGRAEAVKVDSLLGGTTICFSSCRRCFGFHFFVVCARGPPSGGWRPYRPTAGAACRGGLYGRGAALWAAAADLPVVVASSVLRDSRDVQKLSWIPFPP